jgi:hypothetical protein
VKYIAIFIGCVVAGCSIAAAIELAVFLFAPKMSPTAPPLPTVSDRAADAEPSNIVTNWQRFIINTEGAPTTTELLFDTSTKVTTTNLLFDVRNHGASVFAITHDGNIQFGPGVEPTEAARVFAAELERLLGVHGGATNAEAAP